MADETFVQVPGAEAPAAERPGRKPRAAAATAAAPAAPAPKRRFRVQLRDNLPFEVEAADAHEAIGLYRERCGILATIHPFEVEEVRAEG